MPSISANVSAVMSACTARKSVQLIMAFFGCSDAFEAKSGMEVRVVETGLSSNADLKNCSDIITFMICML